MNDEEEQPKPRMIEKALSKNSNVNNDNHNNNNNNNNDNEFTYLFNGQSIDGWRMAGLGKFVLVEHDNSLQSEGGMGLLWYTKKKYKDLYVFLC